jgi:hypothetical protein
VFAADLTIPDGIKYQIQIFTLSKPAAIKSLKGLCPIFETRSASGRYIYRVGLFNEYQDVLSHLNAVKKLGFRNAYIVGYVDGKEMTVNQVRVEEKKRKEAAVVLCNVIIVPSDASDGVMLEGIRQQASGKDVARSEERIIVGPFSSKAQAAALVEFVEVMGYGDATIENTER